MAQLERVIFTGGGTGGHLFPGLSVVEQLGARFPQCRSLFIGSERGIELRILKEAGLLHRSLPVKSSTALTHDPIRFFRSFWRSRQQSQQWLREFHPQVVVGLGGFASVPVIQVAQSMQIPTLLLEQNVVMGRANRWLARKASAICHAFQESIPERKPSKKHWLTGNPVRKEISQLHSTEKPTAAVRTILILGGSQGAQAVNRMWLSAIQTLKPQLDSRQILHQTGERDCESVREQYHQLGLSSIAEPFFEVLPTLYRQADLVISRAGATTLAEIACAGIPAILIPYPNSVGDHQQKNAELFERVGASLIIPQSMDDDPGLQLREQLTQLLDQPLDEMRSAIRLLAQPDAADRVVDVIDHIAS